VSAFEVFAYVLLALSFSYRAVTELRWFVSLLAASMVCCAISAIIRYARQRETRSLAV
jgi:hypothetical protein